MMAKMTSEETLAKTGIIAIAQRLGAGQYANQLCPTCTGGKDKERSLSINIETNGVIRYNCFRASCGFSGTAYSSPGLRTVPESDRPTQAHLNPYTGDFHPLSKREVTFFETRYRLDAGYIKDRIYRTSDRYALPILDPTGVRRGYV